MSDTTKLLSNLLMKLAMFQSVLDSCYDEDNPNPYSLEEMAKVRKEMQEEEAHENRQAFINKKCGGHK